MAVRKAGGLCLKFTSPGWSGAPDRLVLFPEGKMAFVEVKRPGERPRPLQEARLSQLRKMGFKAEVLDDPEQIPLLVEKIAGEEEKTAKDGGGVGVKP